MRRGAEVSPNAVSGGTVAALVSARALFRHKILSGRAKLEQGGAGAGICILKRLAAILSLCIFGGKSLLFWGWGKSTVPEPIFHALPEML
jgi:hypothetical protein